MQTGLGGAWIQVGGQVRGNVIGSIKESVKRRGRLKFSEGYMEGGHAHWPGSCMGTWVVQWHTAG